MKTCKWCGNTFDRLAKSHVIPSSFLNYKGKGMLFVIPPKERKIRRQAGSYDQEILCHKCEADFQSIDCHASDILLKDFENYLIPFGDKKDEIAYQLDRSCFQKIKRFLIYTLWKASLSSLDEFCNVDLGVKYENLIKDVLINNVELEPHQFSFVAYKIGKLMGCVLPHRVDRYGVTYYLMDLACYTFEIKVDQRPTPQKYKSLAEHEHIIIIKLDEMPEGKKRAMVHAVKENERLFGRKGG